MKYPKELLAPGEKVNFETRPHFRALWFPIVMLVLIVGIGGYLYAVAPWDWAKTGILIVGVILIVPFVIVKFLRWLTTEYVFTNRRIIVRSGIIAKTGQDMPLQKMNNVNFDMSVMGRLLNYGRLRIDSANADGGLVIEDVPNVEVIQRRIYQWTEEDDARRRAGGMEPGTDGT